MVQQWRGGKRTKSKIGSYPAMSLAEAREIFKRDFAEVIQKGSSIKIAGDTRAGTVADLFEAYVKYLEEAGKASWPEAKKSLDKIAGDLGHNRLARDISPDDLLGILRPIYERGKPAMADHIRSYIRSAYSWGIKSEHDYRNSPPRRFKLINNPAAGIPTEPKVVGTRWLDDDEFVKLYRWLECPRRYIRPTPAPFVF
jgi:integrase